MASTLVIKVKCEDILRRFNARINETNQLDFDVIALRAKIISLFKFLGDANFIMRYVDEDGDLVTLVDDDDLRDIMRQKLKLLRIDVHIINENGNGGTYNNNAWSHENVKNPFTSANIATAFDALKSLTKPLSEFVSNLSLSKIASSSPVQLTDHADNNTSPIDLNVPCDSNPSQFTNVNAAPVSSVVANGDGKEVKIMDIVVEDDNDNDTGSVSSSYASPLTTTMSNSSQSVMPHDEDDVHKLDGPWLSERICFASLRDDLCDEADYFGMDLPMSNDIDEYPPYPTFLPNFQAKSTRNGMIFKLDSEFILDVNVVDGTMMAPSTAFTKIWRMRNNGTTVWPQGTQLVWIGGDKFSDLDSVTLEIPAYGVSVHKDFDIAVDFRAPRLPGKYISYWRMASPTGTRFGQSVWVYIQVYDISQGLDLNLNISLDSSVYKEPDVIDINGDDDALLESCNCFNASTELENQMVNKHFSTQELKDISSSLVEKIRLLEVDLLEELKEMGYENNVLEQSLKDLYGVSMWDAITNGRVN